jgi:hypothetical protein
MKVLYVSPFPPAQDGIGVPVLASTAGGLGEQFADSRWTFPQQPRTSCRGSRRLPQPSAWPARDDVLSAADLGPTRDRRAGP